jgi:adenosylhomocysteine nucleosidase
MPCIVFPLGVEAYQFLGRVETLRRWKRGKATFRRVFFEGRVFSVVRCGMGPQWAAAAIQNLDDEPSAIICAGSAGGLAPDLKIGHLVVSSETVDGNDPCEILSGDQALVEQVTRALRKEGRQFMIGRVVTVNSAVFRREEREALLLETGASAVDMESHAIGLEARKRSVPFTALRVISDDLDSPPLPDSRDFRRMWRNPTELPKKLPEFLRWRGFLRDFRFAVSALHPVLVTVIREWDMFQAKK